MRETDYNFLNHIRLWKAGIEDEGVRAITQLMEKNNDIRTLELLDVRITSLGCEFFKKAFMRPLLEGQTGVKFLHLDHNDIGDSGMKFLSEGLAMNETLHTLSVS